MGCRDRANQGGLLPRGPQRSWWWGGVWGPELGQGLPRPRLLCPWLLSQGQTFPGVQGHHGAGEGGGQVGEHPCP